MSAPSDQDRDKIRAQAKAKLKEKLQFVREHVGTNKTRGLAEHYWLEALDPEHRDKDFLKQKLEQWKATPDADNNFLTWLKTQTDAQSQEMHRVLYATETERQKYELTFKDGYVYRGGELFDTSSYKGKTPGLGAYVVSPEGKFYALEHKTGEKHHSTMLAGERVVCAGMMKVVGGKIVSIDNKSGHYRPTESSLHNAVQTLPKDCFATTGTVNTSRMRFSFSLQWMKSDYKAVRLLGKIFGFFENTTKEPPQTFLARTVSVSTTTKPALSTAATTPISQPIATASSEKYAMARILAATTPELAEMHRKIRKQAWEDEQKVKIDKKALEPSPTASQPEAPKTPNSERPRGMIP